MEAVAQKKSRPGVEQQRQDILQAAVALFARAGTAAVSVSAICKQAGVSRDTFYRCYDNKEQVVQALYGFSVNANMLAIASDPAADFASPAWLRPAIDRMVDAILAHQEVARFLFLESADPTSPAREVITGAFDSIAATMQRWCRDRYGHAPSRACFTGLLSAAQWLVHGAIVDGAQAPAVKAAKQAIEELFLATFRGLQQAR